MISPQNCKPSVIPLFGQNTDHSSVPAKICNAVARSRGQGRPLGRRASASPLTAASTMAALRSLGTMLCIVAILASSLLLNGAAHAEQGSSATRRPNDLSLRPFAAFVTEASRRFGVPEHWIRGVMHVESSAKQRARSSKGAMGLMQIMPKTWTELQVRHRLGADPYDPHDNILAGTAYIRELHDRYGVPGFLAAYNAGPGRYERHLATGRPLPDETQGYVSRLALAIESKQTGAKITAVAKSSTLAGSPLFVVRIGSNSTAGRPLPDARPDRRSSGRGVVDLSALVPQSGNLFVHLDSEARSK